MVRRGSATLHARNRAEQESNDTQTRTPVMLKSGHELDERGRFRFNRRRPRVVATHKLRSCASRRWLAGPRRRGSRGWSRIRPMGQRGRLSVGRHPRCRFMPAASGRGRGAVNPGVISWFTEQFGVPVMDVYGLRATPPASTRTATSSTRAETTTSSSRPATGLARSNARARGDALALSRLLDRGERRNAAARAAACAGGRSGRGRAGQVGARRV
jgi:hypothetical protein